MLGPKQALDASYRAGLQKKPKTVLGLGLWAQGIGKENGN